MEPSGRLFQRTHVERIPVRYLAEGREGIGHLKNLSRAGVFVRSIDLPRTGANVVLQFRSPTGSLVDVRGQVRWTTEELGDAGVPPGFGIQLVEPGPAYLEFLRWVRDQPDGEKRDEPPSL